MPIVKVRENEPFDVALRRFKRSCEKAGVLSEVRRREFFEKPTWERKRKKAAAAAQAAQQANIAAQAEANAKASEAAAMSEVQKQQAVLDTKLKFEKGKSGYEIERIRVETQMKKDLMELEFNYNMQLGQQKINKESQREADIETRKDQRARIVGTQQSAMIDQKKNDLLPINFENSDESQGLEI